MPSPSWMPVGMPRPLSRTVHEPSGLSVTTTSLGEARQRLVDGVVDHLVDHVVQAGAVIGVADVHARPLAHRVQALQHLDGLGPVPLGAVGFFGALRVMAVVAAAIVLAHSHSSFSGDFLQARRIHQDARDSTRKAAPETVENTLIFQWFARPFGRVGRRQRKGAIRPSSTRKNCPRSAEPREGVRIGARHPRLAAQGDDLVEQRGPPQRVEVGGDLVEKEDGRGAFPALSDDVAVREHQADQQGLLLARRADLRGHFLGAVPDRQIGAVGAVQRPARGPVALALAAQQPRK